MSDVAKTVEPSLEDVLGGKSLPTSASASGNSDPAKEPTPASGKPEGSPKVDEKDGKDLNSANDSPAKEKEEGKGEDEVPTDADIERTIAERFGLATEEETVDTLRKRYSDSSREAKNWRDKHAAEERERQALVDVLKSQGVKPVKNIEGKFQLVADENYVSRTQEELTRDIMAGLSQKDREELLADPENATRMLVGKILSKTVRLVPTATAAEIKQRFDERIIPVLDKAVTDEKFRDGTARYPDMEMLKPWMDKVMDSPLIPPDFRDWAMQTPDHYKAARKMLYGMVLPIAGPIIAARMNKVKQLEEKKKRAAEEAPIGIGSTGTRGAGKKASTLDEFSKTIAAQIVAAR